MLYSRFQAAAHDELTFPSLAHRSLRLSNQHLIKNGPRRPLLKEEEVASNQGDGFTAQDEKKAAGGADFPTQSPSKEENGVFIEHSFLPFTTAAMKMLCFILEICLKDTYCINCVISRWTFLTFCMHRFCFRRE